MWRNSTVLLTLAALTASLAAALSGPQSTDDVALLQRTGAPTLKELSAEELLAEDEDAEDLFEPLEPLKEPLNPQAGLTEGLSPCVVAGSCPEA
mmetsp:Transcript_115405/g.162236  ORF Transcript_115405/g.162236 Transcript_115405/m.162236 type:complete len:94 (+) Transcript_115405:33-314(+)